MSNGYSLALVADGLSQSFGDRHILHDINLEIGRGQIVSLVGPSGCGKSTLFNAILGTLKPTTGKITVYDHGGVARPVVKPDRDRGIVYQRYSLFNHLTASENVALGLMLDRTNFPFRIFRPLRFRRLYKTYLREAEQFLDKLNLAGSINSYPYQMSGGERQRVAVAQALVTKPSILLLDEPFGALDEATRESLQRMLLRLYAENFRAVKDGRIPPYTILIVTHEIKEALIVANRVIGITPYWDWQGEDFNVFPGARIVYDRPAPIFSPDDSLDFERFTDQKDEILQAVFDKTRCRKVRDFRTFWDELRLLTGEGVTYGMQTSRP